jgi:hypothetical protein
MILSWVGNGRITPREVMRRRLDVCLHVLLCSTRQTMTVANLIARECHEKNAIHSQRKPSFPPEKPIPRICL